MITINLESYKEYSTMDYACDIVANNNSDFVIANNIKSGDVPLLMSGVDSSVSAMNFDIDDCCKQNDIFRIKLRKLQEKLSKSSNLQEKFGLMQGFMEDVMPLCATKDLDERTACLFDGEPFSYMVEHKFCMCAERAAMAQYLCQQCGIKSYFVNSYARINNGELDQHAYVLFEDNNTMFVYDPANPAPNDAPRIMKTSMDKVIFEDFIDAINHNADCPDKKQKNGVGFSCKHEDGKKFVYRNICGTEENQIGPGKLREARLKRTIEAQNISSKTANVND